MYGEKLVTKFNAPRLHIRASNCVIFNAVQSGERLEKGGEVMSSSFVVSVCRL
jgi:hypothetical protein